MFNISTKFYDTNAILELGESIYKDKFYISSVTIKELEDIKANRNKDDVVKYKARMAVRRLANNEDKYSVVLLSNDIKKTIEKYDVVESPDVQIIACAKYISEKENIVFVTNDLCCKLIAKNIFKLDVEQSQENCEIYKGYKIITGNTNEINAAMGIINAEDWCVNEYLIIQNTDDGSEREMRYDGANFVPLKLPPSKYIKAKNSLQRCALDALFNKDIPIVAILGTYGTGKSHLCMRMACYHVVEKGNQSKILGVREIRGEGLDPGALPGTLDEKTDHFFAPLAQQLQGGEFELEHLKQEGKLETQIPFYLKGTTYPSTIILVDEAEDLKESQIRLVGTRLGEESRIFFSGDYKQSVLDKSVNNALIKMCNALKGNPLFACVCLDTDVRSKTSQLFADLFND